MRGSPLGSLILVVTALVACGDDVKAEAPPPNAVPIIDAVNLPGTATLTQTGFVLKGTMDVHDEDGSIVSGIIRAPRAMPFTFPIEGGRNKLERFELEFSFMNDGTLMQGQTFTYSIVVVDDQGLESAPSMKQVILE